MSRARVGKNHSAYSICNTHGRMQIYAGSLPFFSRYSPLLRNNNKKEREGAYLRLFELIMEPTLGHTGSGRLSSTPIEYTYGMAFGASKVDPLRVDLLRIGPLRIPLRVPRTLYYASHSFGASLREGPEFPGAQSKFRGPVRAVLGSSEKRK